MSEFDVNDLKSHIKLINYVKTFYSTILPIVRETNYVAFTKCPWHEETDASLALFNNGTYKCFGCGEHGDIVNLVQKIENVTFQDACIIIGNNIGIDVSFYKPNLIHEQYKDQMDNHCRRYWKNLVNDNNALSYLTSRGITQETIDKFRIGLTDKEEYKYRKECSLSNRIVFPILEHKHNNPKCVGAAYRALDDSKPKYINDANLDGRDGQDKALEGLFIKGNMLYGYSLAYNSIIKMNYAILVEGYMDVAALHQTGITNVVGAMGTAVTENQIRALSKITDNILFLLDGDSAGTNAMLKMLPIMCLMGMNVALCILKDGQDPAELCFNNNFDKNIITNKIANNTINAMEYIINDSVKTYEKVCDKERVKAYKNGINIINNIQNQDTREMYKKVLAKKLDL